jgi:SAM-dependent methyltransferase
LGGKVIEVGAGLGTFSRFLLRGLALSRLFLIEPDPENFSRLKARFGKNARVEIKAGFLEDHVSHLQADSLVAVNVLEHIENDCLFLHAANRVLTSGGWLLLFVPAFAWLYGSVDEAAGHFRRYDKPSLRKKIEAAGFKVRHLSYFNLPGILSWFLIGKVLRLKTLTRGQILSYDRWVIPWLSAVERRWHPPLGQSLVAIAQK